MLSTELVSLNDSREVPSKVILTLKIKSKTLPLFFPNQISSLSRHFTLPVMKILVIFVDRNVHSTLFFSEKTPQTLMAIHKLQLKSLCFFSKPQLILNRLPKAYIGIQKTQQEHFLYDLVRTEVHFK